MIVVGELDRWLDDEPPFFQARGTIPGARDPGARFLTFARGAHIAEGRRHELAY
jgi:hypothetical protein